MKTIVIRLFAIILCIALSGCVSSSITKSYDEVTSDDFNEVSDTNTIDYYLNDEQLSENIEAIDESRLFRSIDNYTEEEIIRKHLSSWSAFPDVMALISVREIDGDFFGFSTPVVISLYSEALGATISSNGILIVGGGEHHNTVKLTIELEGREYVLFWNRIRWGVLEYNVLATNNRGGMSGDLSIIVNIRDGEFYSVTEFVYNPEEQYFFQTDNSFFVAGWNHMETSMRDVINSPDSPLQMW